MDATQAVRPEQIAAKKPIAEAGNLLDSPICRMCVVFPIPIVELVIRSTPDDKLAEVLGKLPPFQRINHCLELAQWTSCLKNNPPPRSFTGLLSIIFALGQFHKPIAAGNAGRNNGNRTTGCTKALKTQGRQVGTGWNEVFDRETMLSSATHLAPGRAKNCCHVAALPCSGSPVRSASGHPRLPRRIGWMQKNQPSPRHP